MPRCGGMRAATALITALPFKLLNSAGKAVFGAPEVAWAAPTHDAKFLAVLPNHEVLAYLDAAEANLVWPLARMDMVLSPIWDKLADLFVGLILFMVLHFEMRRYKEWRSKR